MTCPTINYVSKVLHSIPTGGSHCRARSLVLTSELRLLVSVPGASCLSKRMVEVPSRAASCRATASPTTPAPMTCSASIVGSCVDWRCLYSSSYLRKSNLSEEDSPHA